MNRVSEKFPSTDTRLAKVQWPTVLVFALMYGAWLLLTALHVHIPALVLFPLLAYTVALHSSLQHEVIHGHPTRNKPFNTALAFPALGLFVPFERYEILHLQHHRNWLITDPYDDSESYFLARKQWQSCHSIIRAVLRFNNTLIGRLLFGPAIMVVRMLYAEIGLAKRNRDIVFSWLLHFVGVAITLLWLWWVDFGFLYYALAVAYPATSLLMLRAYSEHLPEENQEHRSAIIKSNPLMQLLYLNNNFHRVHHEHPEVPWYRLPRLYKTHYSNHKIHVYPGYWHLIKRFAFKQRYPVQHPFLAKD